MLRWHEQGTVSPEMLRLGHNCEESRCDRAHRMEETKLGDRHGCLDDFVGRER